MQPCKLTDGSPGKENLEIAAKFLSRFNHKNLIYTVGDVFFDAGQNWEWTTLIATELQNGNTYQALNPKEWESIVTATTAGGLIHLIVNFINNKQL